MKDNVDMDIVVCLSIGITSVFFPLKIGGNRKWLYIKWTLFLKDLLRGGKFQFKVITNKFWKSCFNLEK